MKDWSAEEDALIEGYGDGDRTAADFVCELADGGFERNASAVRNRAAKLKAMKYTESVGDVYNEAPQLFNTIQQMQREAYHMPEAFEDSVVGVTDGALRKVLILTDIHFPLQHNGVLQHALANHSDAEVVVLGGDIFDMYSVSFFG